MRYDWSISTEPWNIRELRVIPLGKVHFVSACKTSFASDNRILEKEEVGGIPLTLSLVDYSY